VRALFAIALKSWGLFVDDGSLAAALVIWCAIVGLVIPRLVPSSHAGAMALAAGCIAILLLNVAEAVRGAQTR
jgi:hypothetical protein